MFAYLKTKWLSLDANWRRHVKSAALTFVCAMLMQFFGEMKLHVNEPFTWNLIMAAVATSMRHVFKLMTESWEDTKPQVKL